MSQIATISEFLLQAGTEYRIFDMGRAIRKIPAQQFLDIEHTLLAPQFPRLAHAWYGIVFWNKQLSGQHYIWFVKFPLDEQGLLIPASRDQFLQIIVEALGSQLENAQSTNGQLPDNPYSFVPNQQQLADFNSVSRRSLGLGMSEHYAKTQEYFQHPGHLPWQDLVVQGLADFAAHIQQQPNQQYFISAFKHLPKQVQYSLLVSLENTAIDIKITEVINDWLRLTIDPLDWQHGLRALCQSPCKGMVEALLDTALAHPSLQQQPEIMMIIAGRLWQYLTGEQRLISYLQCVAQIDRVSGPDSHLFAGVYGDLVKIPVMREHLLSLLRSPEKPDVITQAIGKLFSGQ